MRYRPLGSSGLNISVLSFGAWQLGDPDYWGPGDEKDAQAAVDAALDAGINCFDTAEMYGKGESERILGRLLGSRRHEVIVASKISAENCAPGKVRAACEASLQRLNRDYLDLYQIHWPFATEAFADVYEVLSQLRDEGKIRHIGISNFGVRQMNDWLDTGDAVSNQLGYNLLFRAIEYQIAPECRKRNLGILAYMPLMQGLLAGIWNTVAEIPMLRRRTRHFSGTLPGTRHGEEGCEALLLDTLAELRDFASGVGLPLPTLSLAWVVAQPGVTSAIIGARHAAQLQRNAVAGSLDIGPAAVAELDEFTGMLKKRLGANADMWNNEGSSRIV